MIRTVGIDLSLRATGIAHSDGRCLVVGCDGVTRLSIDDQVEILGELTQEILVAACGPPWESEYPDGVCIEGLDMARSYGGQIERSVLWWNVVTFFRGEGVPVWVAPSAQLKIYATGSGNPATTKKGRKSAVVEALSERWPQFDHGGDDNKADAAVCALIAAHMLGGPIHPEDPGFVPLPDTHIRALLGVRSTADPPPGRSRSRG